MTIRTRVTTRFSARSVPFPAFRPIACALFAAVSALPSLSHAAVDVVRINVARADQLVLTIKGRQIIVARDLNTAAQHTASSDRIRVNSSVQEGKQLLTIDLPAGEEVSPRYVDDGKTLMLVIGKLDEIGAALAGGSAPVDRPAVRGVAPISKSTAAASAPAAATAPTPEKQEADEKIAKIIKAGREDLGVPSSPAMTLIGVDPSKAGVARTPKDIAAALVQGRGADGKIKAGVAIDASFAQLMAAFSPAMTQEIKTRQQQAGTPSLFAPPLISSSEWQSLLRQRERTPGRFEAASFITRSMSGDNDRKSARTDGADATDLTHRALNRLKISFATTEDQQSTDKKGIDLAYGLHYVFFDNTDPATSRCDGENGADKDLQQWVKDLLRANNVPPPETLGPGELRKLIQGTYPGLEKKLALQDLAPVLAACSLTARERLGASAAMIGAAEGYKLADGTWSTRKRSARGAWATYVSPGYPAGAFVGADAQLQAILHARATRGQPVADPMVASKTVLQDQNLMSLRLRAAGSRGAGWFEYSHSRNKTDGKPETTRRSGLGLEWKLAEGVWLVGSGGSERSSIAGSKSTPFVITNLRFGGSPDVPAAFPTSQ